MPQQLCGQLHIVTEQRLTTRMIRLINSLFEIGRYTDLKQVSIPDVDKQE